MSWVVGISLIDNSRVIGRALRGDVIMGSYSVFTQASKKTTENSEWLRPTGPSPTSRQLALFQPERIGRQARRGLNLAPSVYQFIRQNNSATGKIVRIFFIADDQLLLLNQNYHICKRIIIGNFSHSKFYF